MTLNSNYLQNQIKPLLHSEPAPTRSPPRQLLRTIHLLLQCLFLLTLIDQEFEPPIIHAVTPSAATAQQVEHVEPEPDSRVEDNELFDVDSRLANRLSSLLTSAGLPACEIASDPNSSTQTKSDCKLRRDCKLKWNPRMNEGPAVLQDEETDRHNEN